MPTCGHVYNTTYPLIKLADLIGGFPLRLEFLCRTAINDTVGERGTLPRRDLRAPSRHSLGRFLADAASGWDGIQDHVDGFAGGLRQQ